MSTANVFDELKRRGFAAQTTDPEPLYELLGKESVTFYIGFDPTSDSLHVGHLMGVMAMSHMQKYGHRPIAIVGGGTAMVGDPSGKTEMRKMMKRETVVENSEKLKAQLSRYVEFDTDKAILVDNYEWLGSLNYIDFLRDIGRHFSVNKMLTYETYKRRLETGLSFLEFNYQLLQAFDFYMLYKKYNCRLQMGGDDQWANILAGADLVRRIEGANVYGHTFPLIMTASGQKMGKTEVGALWLDPQKTSPYDYYQYWVNVDDRDVAKCLAFFTFLPMDEIDDVSHFTGVELNVAKTILAFEATKLTHGEKAAHESLTAAVAAFGTRHIPTDILPSSTIMRGSVQASEKSIPSIGISLSTLQSTPRVTEILGDYKLTASRGEARRLIQQGGVYVNEKRITNIEAVLSPNDIIEGKIAVRLGKKKHFYIIVK
ncbi:tyrosine--tRNA ligase [candidate division KSB1 bacterium]|nr:tyrosine--tRNA ligase [candidate division KSB1 bacterium]RQW01437.1 MAG: tyrosine--tRNA ligase [candidate division KSB1 bacterium]